MNGVEYKGTCCGGSDETDDEEESKAAESHDISASGTIIGTAMAILSLI